MQKKTIKNIGLDVHKNSISIGTADEGRDGEVRYYGKIDNSKCYRRDPFNKHCVCFVAAIAGAVTLLVLASYYQ